MSVGIIILLVVLGIVLLLVEFLVVPGVTIAGIAGTLLIIGGVIAAYIYQETKVANYIALGSGISTIIIFAFAFRTKTWQNVGLKANIDGHSGEDVSDFFQVGDEGEAVSRLTPIGKVQIKDQLVEARSLGGIIYPGTKIKIVRTEKNKLFVEPIK